MATLTDAADIVLIEPMNTEKLESIPKKPMLFIRRADPRFHGMPRAWLRITNTSDCCACNCTYHPCESTAALRIRPTAAIFTYNTCAHTRIRNNRNHWSVAIEETSVDEVGVDWPTSWICSGSGSHSSMFPHWHCGYVVNVLAVSSGST